MSPITENSIAFWDNVIAEATWLTVTDAAALYDPEEAVIVAVPLLTEVRIPESDTATTVGSDVVQSTSLMSVMLFPLLSSSLMGARAVSPRAENDVSASASDATTWFTVTDAALCICPEMHGPGEPVSGSTTQPPIFAVPLPTEVTIFVLLRLSQTV